MMEARTGPAPATIAPSEILLAAAIALWAAALLLRNDPGGLFIDPDSYMRLARFRDGYPIFHGGFSPRDNAPYGAAVPWTMPMDGALVVFYAIGRAFTDANGALYFAARVVSPFFCVTIGPIMFFGLRPFFSLRARVVIAGLAATAPKLLLFSFPGQADHHAMIVWLSALFAVALIRYLFLDRARYGHAAAAGIAAAVALWTSPEEFVVVGTGLAALVLYRCMVARPRADRTWAKDLALGLAFVLTLTAAWLVDAPYDGLWAREVDRLSIVYVSFAWLFSAALLGLDAYLAKRAAFSPSRNLIVGALLGAAAFLCWIAIAPDILGGPLSQVDQALFESLVDQNLEMQPLWRLNMASAAAWICLLLIWIAFAVLIARTSGAERRLWVACAVLAIPISALGIRYTRSLYFIEVLGSIPLGLVLAHRTRQYPKYMGYSAVALSTGVMLGAYGATLFLWAALTPSHQHGEAAGADCGPERLSEAIAPIRDSDAIVMTELDFAPMALYLSPHLRTVSAGYIRNTQGVLDVLAFVGARDDEEARAILERRTAKFVLVCDRGEQSPAHVFNEHILRKTPAWLEQVGACTPQSGFCLYRVRSGDG